MEGYVLSLVILAIAVFLLHALAPASQGLKTVLRHATACAVLGALFLPLGTLLPSLELPNLSLSPPLSEGNSVYAAAMAEGYEKGIEADLAEKWGLRDFSVCLCQNESGVPLSVTVVLRGGDRLADGVGICRYAEAAYGIPCGVEYE